MGKLVNFDGGTSRGPAIGKHGLQLLCQSLNAARAERDIPQRYRIVAKGGVDTLEIVTPDAKSVRFDNLGNRPKSTTYRLSQADVDRIVSERGRELSIMRDRGLIHKTDDGRFVPA